MHNYTRSFRELDRTSRKLAGGKGANLGELSRIPGIQVPPGFCVTTEAYVTIVRLNREIDHLLDELQQLGTGQLEKIAKIAARIRTIIEESVIPVEIAKDIIHSLGEFGEAGSFAIRSSATAEDLPDASFAGQQDSYLDIAGKDAILLHIKKCWASLFTDRAVVYRIRNGFDHRNVQLAVVVQQMVFPTVSGIMFTADPVTGNRKQLAIDAGFGLGDALVSGLVNAQHYKVHDGNIVEHPVATTQPGEHPLTDEPALTTAQILRLEQTGRTIERHFGQPQDIEWCLAGDRFYIVQARPVTTLFPVPENDAPGNHVYISVGHQQMMTDPMKPLGLSLWQLMAFRPMHKAAGRLYIDVAASLATPAGRETLLKVMEQHDPLIRDALATIIARGDFIPGLQSDNSGSPAATLQDPIKPWTFQSKLNNDPAIVSALLSRSEAAIAATRREIATRSGPELFDFILGDIAELKKRLADSQSIVVITTAIEASHWLNEKMKAWLGETNAADKVSQSIRDNITSEMGLALLDVADEIRPFPEVVDYLEHSLADDFLELLPERAGGRTAKDAITGFLAKYGMRCAGEIDITKTRWSERPATLIPILLGNIRNFPPGAAKTKFEAGLLEVGRTERSLLDRLSHLPDGAPKAAETEKVIGLIRNFIGYREYPKYQIVNHLFLYKQALLREAGRLQQAGVIRDREDVYYLGFAEFREAVQTNQIDDGLIASRKAGHQSFERLRPPRVITSDGEIIAGTYNHERLPPGALPGLPVSTGVVEGRARVILDMRDADLVDGDILITPFTDPSWTPLFVAIKGLVTEVGGLMTHGAVIAREYGLPAVVGVEQATLLIQDGQRIRVNGTDGFVEILHLKE